MCLAHRIRLNLQVAKSTGTGDNWRNSWQADRHVRSLINFVCASRRNVPILTRGARFSMWGNGVIIPDFFRIGAVDNRISLV